MTINNFKKYRGKILMILLVLASIILVGCSKEEIELTYDSFVLENAQIDEEYNVSLATAEGSDEIEYTVVDGELPKGITLSKDGILSGVPEVEELNVTFTVQAQVKEVKVSADFTLNIIGKQSNEVIDYIFEAEYVDLSEKVGAGPSNAAPGVTMIRKDSEASNGHYIADTYKEGLSFEFEFNANSDGEGLLTLSLGSDLGVIEMNPNVFEISVNGEVVNYQSFKLPDSSGRLNKVFREFAINNIMLVEGENEIKLTIKDNTYINGSAGGPLIDFLKVTTDIELEWNPVLENIS